MRKTFLVATVFVFVLTAANIVAAQGQGPPLQGCEPQQALNGVVFDSPGREKARPILLLMAPMPPKGDPEEWFGSRVMDVAKSAGTPGEPSRLEGKAGID